MEPASRRRLIVAITGASGAVYGVRLLDRLREAGVETHLLVSSAGVLNLHQELGLSRAAVETKAHHVRAATAVVARTLPRARSATMAW